ncbi:MAG: flagellar motor switch protein FliG [Armatimonadota bacterium]|nr:flagellar motor switch protein FliG [bacterium]
MASSENPKVVKNQSGLRRASMLMVALGTELSSIIMQQLTPDEIERLTAEIVTVNRLDPTSRRLVIEDCRKDLADVGIAGGTEYARKLLEQVLGEAKATEVLGKLSSDGGNALRWLRTAPARQLAQCLANERPQIAALVIGHLPPEQGAQVMSALPEKAQGEVALRLTVMQPTDPETVKNVADILLQRLATTENAVFTEVGGNKSVVQILNNVDRSTEKKILEYLTEVDETIANQIKESMFVFENILGLEDRAIQIILRDVPQEDLRLALKGSNNDVKEVFFHNMSSRAVETLKEDLDSSGPVKLRDVEAAQLRIASIARQLDEAGEISIRDTGEEVLV